MRDGVLFVATGAGYRRLAARAAASVARVSPGLPIDLATDEPVEPGDFATVTLLDDPWFRSRIDAMAATRFERTLHLDADVLAVADLRDVFEVLDRFDIALAHDQARNSPAANTVWRRPLPDCVSWVTQSFGLTPALTLTPTAADGGRCWPATSARTAPSCTRSVRPASIAAPRAPAGSRGAIG